MITINILSDKDINNVFCINCGNNITQEKNNNKKLNNKDKDSIKTEFNISKISNSFINKIKKVRFDNSESSKFECSSCNELIKINIMKE